MNDDGGELSRRVHGQFEDQQDDRIGRLHESALVCVQTRQTLRVSRGSKLRRTRSVASAGECEAGRREEQSQRGAFSPKITQLCFHLGYLLCIFEVGSAGCQVIREATFDPSGLHSPC